MRKRQGASGRSPRQLRVGEEMRHALVRILARGELHDPLLADAQVTVTEVRVSPDLRAATAFVTPFGGGDSTALVKALNHAGGYFRGQIAREVDLQGGADDPLCRRYQLSRNRTGSRNCCTIPVVARDLEPETAPKPGRRKGPSGDGA